MQHKNTSLKPIEILLVEDNPGDVRLTREALAEGKLNNHLSHVSNGVEALDFLHRNAGYEEAPLPDLILLDLNLPMMDGREVLTHIKNDENLMRIPVVILTTSAADKDVRQSYNLHANCYITKPVGLDQLISVVQSIEDFWFSIVKLPPK